MIVSSSKRRGSKNKEMTGKDIIDLLRDKKVCDKINDDDKNDKIAQLKKEIEDTIKGKENVVMSESIKKRASDLSSLLIYPSTLYNYNNYLYCIEGLYDVVMAEYEVDTQTRDAAKKNNDKRIQKEDSLLKRIIKCLVYKEEKHTGPEYIFNDCSISEEAIRALMMPCLPTMFNSDGDIDEKIERIISKSIGKFICENYSNLSKPLTEELLSSYNKNISEINKSLINILDSSTKKMEDRIKELDELLDKTTAEFNQSCANVVVEINSTCMRLKKVSDKSIEGHKKICDKSIEEHKRIFDEFWNKCINLFVGKSKSTSDIDDEGLKKEFHSMQVEYEQQINDITETSKREIKKLNKEIAELKSNGKWVSQPCPYCGSREERMLIAGKCRCDICGHSFTGIDPNISDISDEQVKADMAKPNKDNEDKEATEWRKRHTAQMERVSIDVGKCLYRIKLEEDTVSSKGVLIIPPKCNRGESIETIDFCQPNVGDKDGEKRIKKVKTLILPKGIDLGKYNDEDLSEKWRNINKLYWDYDETKYNDKDRCKKTEEA